MRRTRSSGYDTDSGSNKKVKVEISSDDELYDKNAIERLSKVELTKDQIELKSRIFKFIRGNLKIINQQGDGHSSFIIQGDPGTGKSVILNSLFNDIQRISKSMISQGDGDKEDILVGTNNYLLVNHPEMLKLYRRVCRSYPYIKMKELERPTSLINKFGKLKTKADIVIIDEAHLLATNKDGYKRFYGNNHLEEIMKVSKITVIVYDDRQSLRMGNYWSHDGVNGDSIERILSNTVNKEYGYLNNQFRIKCEKDVLEWINEITTSQKINSLPRLDLIKREMGDENAFEFKIWDNAGEMYQYILNKDSKYGKCRIISTYDFPYKLNNGKKEDDDKDKDWYVSCGDKDPSGFRLRWDRYIPEIQLPWSERPDTIEEVGSVYTVQGFDLNYAAVILGPCIGYDPITESITVDPKLYEDSAGFKKCGNITQPDSVKERIILNSINVLLTRGVSGLSIYAYDWKLRKKLMEMS
ncbi:unnamed protein product [[Candida] boidinii]|uniref:Unnamed protein product n=1 Tax=Candida boidinii TaxID=5477 RepID=A0A9W6T4Y3_CANBO|nr:hypothetical protein B5S30_g3015 [[Candida] boidinii]GME72797.1 unnamed protein product [[Candida] boidinii]